MAEVKWIKLTTDMFDNKKIKKIRRLPEGNNIILIWVELLTMAGKCNAGGMIFISENIPYDIESLADDLGFGNNVEVVRLALRVLQEFKMIITDETSLEIANWYEYQSATGLESIREYERDRKREYRKRQKELALIEQEKSVSDNFSDKSTDSSISISNSISNSNIKYIDNIKDIIDYLNNKLNTKYRYDTESNNKLIRARLNEGYTVEDFKTVIDKKFDEWNGTDMAKHLKPSTLFAPSHFSNYLNQIDKIVEQPKQFNFINKPAEITMSKEELMDGIF